MCLCLSLGQIRFGVWYFSSWPTGPPSKKNFPLFSCLFSPISSPQVNLVVAKYLFFLLPSFCTFFSWLFRYLGLISLLSSTPCLALQLVLSLLVQRRNSVILWLTWMFYMPFSCLFIMQIFPLKICSILLKSLEKCHILIFRDLYFRIRQVGSCFLKNSYLNLVFAFVFVLFYHRETSY